MQLVNIRTLGRKLVDGGVGEDFIEGAGPCVGVVVDAHCEDPQEGLVTNEVGEFLDGGGQSLVLGEVAGGDQRADGVHVVAAGDGYHGLGGEVPSGELAVEGGRGDASAVCCGAARGVAGGAAEPILMRLHVTHYAPKSRLTQPWPARATWENKQVCNYGLTTMRH